MKRAFRAIVHGRVQGVSFRYYTQLTAEELGVQGYVRNLPDGTVEVAAEGEEQALTKLAAWLHRGPRFAAVERVDLSWSEPSLKERSFRVKF